MKSVILLASLAVTSSVYATEPTPEQCQVHVTETIDALQTASNITGTQRKLKDLSIKDIQLIVANDGVCAASREIYKRVLGN